SLIIDGDDIINAVCDEYGGIIRNIAGDIYILTFIELHQTLTAAEKLCRDWNRIIQRYGLGLSVGIHKGDVHILRSYVYGNDINVAVHLTNLGRMLVSNTTCSVVTSQSIKNEVQGTRWEQAFNDLNSDKIGGDLYRTLIEKHGAYQFTV